MTQRSPTPRPGRTSRTSGRDNRWEDILHASAQIFSEKGYEGASLQDIADAVGLLKGSIYYYIKTKEDLLFEITMRAQASWREVMRESGALRASSAPARLVAFVHRWLDLAHVERKWSVVSENEFTRLSEPYLRTVIAGRREYTAFVTDIISHGVADGDFDPNLDTRLATDMVFALLQAIGRTGRDRRTPTRDEIVDSCATFIVRGLGGSVWRSEHEGATAIALPSTNQP